MVKETKYLVFMYQDSQGYNYLRLDNREDTKGVEVLYGKKMNCCSVGVIVAHEMETQEDGRLATSVHNARQSYASGYWQDKAQVMEWKERNRQFQAMREGKKPNPVNLETELKHIREVYRNLPATQRSAFLTQITYTIIK